MQAHWLASPFCLSLLCVFSLLATVRAFLISDVLHKVVQKAQLAFRLFLLGFFFIAQDLAVITGGEPRVMEAC